MYMGQFEGKGAGTVADPGGHYADLYRRVSSLMVGVLDPKQVRGSSGEIRPLGNVGRIKAAPGFAALSGPQFDQIAGQILTTIATASLHPRERLRGYRALMEAASRTLEPSTAAQECLLGALSDSGCFQERNPRLRLALLRHFADSPASPQLFERSIKVFTSVFDDRAQAPIVRAAAVRALEKAVRSVLPTLSHSVEQHMRCIARPTPYSGREAGDDAVRPSDIFRLRPNQSVYAPGASRFAGDAVHAQIGIFLASDGAAAMRGNIDAAIHGFLACFGASSRVSNADLVEGRALRSWERFKVWTNTQWKEPTPHEDAAKAAALGLVRGALITGQESRRSDELTSFENLLRVRDVAAQLILTANQVARERTADGGLAQARASFLQVWGAVREHAADFCSNRTYRYDPRGPYEVSPQAALSPATA